jgi:drug/metabolite transporter (DMT)-like permease
MQASAPTARWWPDFLLLAALWGASFLFMRVAGQTFGALAMAEVRVAVAALLLWPIMVWQGHGGAMRAHWRAALLIGLLNSALPFALYGFAVLHISTGLAAILNATVPMFGALVAWAWLGERPGLQRLLGLAIGFAGVVGLTLSRPGSDGGQASLWPVLACLGATLSYAVAASLTRRYLVAVPPLVSATGSQIGAALGLLVPALLSLPPVMPGPTAWAAVVAVGVLCTGVAYILYFRLIERAGPVRTLTVTYLIPVFALLYGTVLLDEVILPSMLASGAVILLGTALASGLLARRR